MSKNNLLQKEISELSAILNKISNLNNEINSIITNLIKCLKSGNKIFKYK